MAIKDGKLIEATYQPTPNHGGPLKDPQYIVVHYTAGRSAGSSARWLCDPKSRASAHLIIGRDCTLIQLCSFGTVAWHAGESEWKGLHGLNKFSIGVELDNPGLVSRVNGRWRSLTLGIDYPDSDVVEAPHPRGGPVRGWVLYSPAQLQMLEDICRELVAEYPTIQDALGHWEIAPGRKLDPGGAFELDVFRSRLFGRAD